MPICCVVYCMSSTQCVVRSAYSSTVTQSRAVALVERGEKTASDLMDLRSAKEIGTSQPPCTQASYYSNHSVPSGSGIVSQSLKSSQLEAMYAKAERIKSSCKDVIMN